MAKKDVPELTEKQIKSVVDYINALPKSTIVNVDVTSDTRIKFEFVISPDWDGSYTPSSALEWLESATVVGPNKIIHDFVKFCLADEPWAGFDGLYGNACLPSLKEATEKTEEYKRLEEYAKVIHDTETVLRTKYNTSIREVLMNNSQPKELLKIKSLV